MAYRISGRDRPIRSHRQRAGAAARNYSHFTEAKFIPAVKLGVAKRSEGTIDASDHLFVLGETLRPLLTNAMGSSLEVFDTSGLAGAGPLPHCHPWEKAYLVLEGRLEVVIDGESHVIPPGGVAHVPAGVRTATGT